jgi:hypothetical protein
MVLLSFLAERDAMANSKVTLLRRVRVDGGWRYYPADYAQNGKVKPEVVIVAGQEVKHPTGYYALRYYKGAKLIIAPEADGCSRSICSLNAGAAFHH